MNKTSRLSWLLACLGIVLTVAVACVAPPTPVPAAATPSNAITNIVWQWTSVTTKPTGETTTVADPQNYTITFRDDGTLSGKADCNNFTGTYSQEGGFTITLGASTMAACAEGSLDQQYLELLSAVVAGGPDGQGNLALENAGGEKRMLFKNGGAAPAQ
jgi:heat shock protein HslJ